MSGIKEARELVQDLIAPELRAIGAKVDALSLRMDEQTKALGLRVDEQTKALSLRMDEQAQSVERRGAERHAEIKADIAALRTEISLQMQIATLSRQVAELTAAREANAQ